MVGHGPKMYKKKKEYFFSKSKHFLSLLGSKLCHDTTDRLE